LRWTAEQSKKNGGGALFVTYEQIRPNDAFGKIMIENLRRRGCELKGLEAHPDLESEENRFKRLGWSNSHAVDMNAVYSHVIPDEEIKRIEKIELFDEFEEWHLISAHYCICVSTVDSVSAAPPADEEKKASTKIGKFQQVPFMSIPAITPASNALV
jgi:tRNA wybutosine-synthesizing protein 4